MDVPVILMHGLSQEEAVAVMRAVKAALGDPAKAAFAMTTETSLDWKVRDLIEHLAEEHAFHQGQKT
jgi:hypothetical protein